MMRFVAAFARRANGAGAVSNWVLYVLWGNWWNAAAAAVSTLVFGELVLSYVPRWWHSLFHMAEPCGLCGHTKKHKLYDSGYCNEKLTEGLPDPVYRGVVPTSSHCYCTRRKMNEHRITEARRQGSAGAAAGAFQLANYANPNPYAAAGANQGLGGYSQHLQQLMQQVSAGYGLGLKPPALPEAAWADETYTGYRAFILHADPERGVFRLKSVTEMGTMWESATLDAKCAHRSITSAPQPEDMSSHMGTCTCGIYLCSQQETVVRQAFTESLDAGNSLVLAQCAGWGTVVEHTDGMRVEHARIERLWTLSGKPELCDRLAGIYGVPCTNLWASIK